MGAKWVNEDVACLWRISRTISSISVRSSGASSRHRSYTIDIRFRRECQSVDNLFERRASNVSHLRNRARARARVPLLPHSGFRTFFVPGHCARGRGWPFSAAMFINESQLQSTDRTRIFIAGEKSHVARHHDRNSVPSNSIKMSMSRAIWG